MNTATVRDPSPSAEPGALATHRAVDIHERQAWHVNGFIGVLAALVSFLAAAGLLAWAAFAAMPSRPSARSRSSCSCSPGSWCSWARRWPLP